MKGTLPRQIGITGVIKHLGRVIAYHPRIAKALGVKEAIFIDQMLFWAPRARNEKGEGWVFKSSKDLYNETGLTYKEQLRIRENLEEKEVIEQEYARLEHLLWVKVDEEKLDSLLSQIVEDDSDNGISPSAQREDGEMPKGQMANRPKVRSFIGSESTPKTTPESTDLTDLDDSTSEETPPSKKEENPTLSYRAAKNIFRKYCHKNLGNLNEAYGEAWAGLIRRHGEKIVLGAVELWAKELGARGKGLGFPIAVFLKNSDERIEDFEVESSSDVGVESADEKDESGTQEYLAMLRREKEKLKKRNG